MKRLLFAGLASLFTYSGFAQVLKKPIPDKLVVLTFDDAPKTHYTFVAPLLNKYGFGATFFVCEFPPDFSDTSKYMTWSEMQQLAQMGFEVANHTRDHVHVNKMNGEKLSAQLAYIENKCDSLHMGHPVSFAYPGYDTSPAAFETLHQRGYAWARAGGYRLYDPATDHPYLIPSYTTLKDNRDQIMEALRGARNGKIVVLTVHGVPDYAHDWVTTPPELFAQYLKYLHDHHYKVIAMKDLSQYIDAGKAYSEIKPDWTLKTK